MDEEYKIAFEDYEVSNFGNVRRKLKNGNYKSVGGSIDNRGYKYFQLQRNGNRINNHIHYLVAKSFLGERLDNQVIDHIDRNKLNNNVSNLRYTTQKDNCKNQDRYILEIEETDPKKRKKLVDKLYRNKNRTELLEKKRIYYENNKDRLWKDENGNWK